MINQLAERIHNDAKSKGFYDKQFNVAEKLMLIVSELSEAMEADRKGKHVRKDWFIDPQVWGDEFEHIAFQDRIKDTFEDELADAVIRIFDLAAAMGVDLEKHIIAKMKYNATREFMHGKKY